MAFFKDLINKLKGQPTEQQADVPVQRETFREKVGDFRETLSNKLKQTTVGQIPSAFGDVQRNLRRELPGQMVRTVREQAKPTFDFIKTFAQAIPRAGLSTAMTTVQKGSEKLDERFQGSKLDKKLESMGIKPSLKIREDVQVEPKTKVGQAILGKEPVKTYGKRGEEFQTTVKEATGVDIGKPLATAAVAAGTLLDLVPGFGGEKKALTESLSAISKANKAEGIFPYAKSIFKAANVSKTDDEIMAISKNLENVTDEKQIADELASAIKGEVPPIKETIKRAEGIQPFEEPKIPTPETGTRTREYSKIKQLRDMNLPKELDSLLTENTMYTQKTREQTRKDAIELVGNKSTDELIQMSKENATPELMNVFDAINRTTVNNFDKLTAAEKVEAAKDILKISPAEKDLQVRTGQAMSALYHGSKQEPVNIIKDYINKINDYNIKASLKNQVDLSPERIANLTDELLRVSKMEDNFEKTQATFKLFRDMERDMPSPAWKRFTNAVKAGLLTGMNTLGINITSTLGSGIVAQVSKIPATLIDMGIALKTKKRTVATTIFDVKYGTKELKKSFEDAKKLLQTGVDVDQTFVNPDYFRINYPKTKIGNAVQKYTDTVYDVLNAQDKLTYNTTRAMSLLEQAKVDIKNNGLKFADKAERDAYISNFMKNPPDSALLLATEDAKYATYRNSTMAGEILKAAKGILETNPTTGVLGEFIIPFSNTPSAVASNIIDYIPGLGLVKEIAKITGRGFDQRSMSNILGRQMTGMGLVYTGMKIYQKSKDVITTSYPTDQKERAEWEKTGKKPWSIKIDDKWVPLATFGPAGGLLGFGAMFSRGKEETGSISGGIVSASTGVGSYMLEQPFLTGAQAIQEAVASPTEKGMALLNNFGRMLVPSLVGKIASSIDPNQRKTDNPLQAIMSKIPGLRNTLPEKRDVMGQVLTRERSAVGELISPLRLSREKVGDASYNEILRLNSVGEDIRPTKINKSINGVPLTVDEYNKMQSVQDKMNKSVLQDFINSPEYQESTDAEKAKALNKVLDGIKTSATKATFGSIIKQRYNLSPDYSNQDVNDVVYALNKNPKFKKLSEQKQGEAIKKVLSSYID